MRTPFTLVIPLSRENIFGIPIRVFYFQTTRSNHFEPNGKRGIKVFCSHLLNYILVYPSCLNTILQWHTDIRYHSEASSCWHTDGRATVTDRRATVTGGGIVELSRASDSTVVAKPFPDNFWGIWWYALWSDHYVGMVHKSTYATSMIIWRTICSQSTPSKYHRSSVAVDLWCHLLGLRDD